MKIENQQNGQENMAGKTTRTCIFRGKIQKCYDFFKF